MERMYRQHINFKLIAMLLCLIMLASTKWIIISESIVAFRPTAAIDAYDVSSVETMRMGKEWPEQCVWLLNILNVHSNSNKIDIQKKNQSLGDNFWVQHIIEKQLTGIWLHHGTKTQHTDTHTHFMVCVFFVYPFIFQLKKKSNRTKKETISTDWMVLDHFERNEKCNKRLRRRKKHTKWLNIRKENTHLAKFKSAKSEKITDRIR